MRKGRRIALWILDINGYLPALMRVTTLAFKNYARRIGAELNVITERRYPDWHVTYEKAQVFLHGRDYDWNIVMDSDLLLHPEFPDLTERLPDFAVGVMDAYPADSRFSVDPYFYRDRRKVGISGVFAMAPRQCFDFWTPLGGVQADHLPKIHPLPDEVARGVPPEHFITEYWLSSNLARFGLKYGGILQPEERPLFFHPYGKEIGGVFHSLTDAEKTQGVQEKARSWGLHA